MPAETERDRDSRGETVRPTDGEVRSYVIEHLDGLASMARDQGWAQLAYFIEMARMAADGSVERDKRGEGKL